MLCDGECRSSPDSLARDGYVSISQHIGTESELEVPGRGISLRKCLRQSLMLLFPTPGSDHREAFRRPTFENISLLHRRISTILA